MDGKDAEGKVVRNDVLKNASQGRRNDRGVFYCKHLPKQHLPLSRANPVGSGIAIVLYPIHVIISIFSVSFKARSPSEISPAAAAVIPLAAPCPPPTPGLSGGPPPQSAGPSCSELKVRRHCTVLYVPGKRGGPRIWIMTERTSHLVIQPTKIPAHICISDLLAEFRSFFFRLGPRLRRLTRLHPVKISIAELTVLAPAALFSPPSSTSSGDVFFFFFFKTYRVIHLALLSRSAPLLLFAGKNDQAKVECFWEPAMLGPSRSTGATPRSELLNIFK